MRFKVDENLPIDVAEILRANNHDAMTIFDQEMVGQPDLQVASVCRAEERALVTLDLDFSDIRTYPPASHAGIIILRPRTNNKGQAQRLTGMVILVTFVDYSGSLSWSFYCDYLPLPTC